MQEESDNADINNSIILTEEFKHNCQAITFLEFLSLFKGDKDNLEENPVVKDTKDYVETFNRYGKMDNLSTKACKVRKIFSDVYKENEDGEKEELFDGIEQTLLIDLAPSTADEAFKLIPTLIGKIKAEELQEKLDILDGELNL